MSNADKLTEAKIKLAQRGAAPSKPSADERIPPGQRLVTNFPVLDLGIQRLIPTHHWRLRLFGLVEREVELDWAALNALPQTSVTIDLHCVTHWSQLDMLWQGVLARTVLEQAGIRPEAQFVMLHSYDGYTTNLPLAAVLADDVLVAHSVFGQPLTREHGAPVRMLVPSRYAWKSAKWLKGIELLAADQAGFWEERGYHNNADPWLEERFS